MEQTVVVRQVFEDGTAEVMLVRESACSGDCHKCSGCGAVKETLLFTANNAIEAVPGDKVIVTSESGPVLKAAAVLYMLPVLLFVAGYILGQLLWQGGALMGGIGFCGGIAIAAGYDHRIRKKQPTVYTITGYSSKMPLNSRIKGDNEVD